MTVQQRFGPYGGRFVPETLMGALDELERAYERFRDDPEFCGGAFAPATGFRRPSDAALPGRRLSERAGCRVYLKREDLAHTGAHKINNTLGQILLATRMGKRRIIAETGAGQHGVATATVAALFGLECHVYMGEEDIRRQELNVIRMRLLGAEVVPVTSGSGTLRTPPTRPSATGSPTWRPPTTSSGPSWDPRPYPVIVRDFQTVIGRETRSRSWPRRDGSRRHRGLRGGGFERDRYLYPFLDDPSVQLVGVEAAGYGLESGKHGASLARGSGGILHGSFSYVLQDEDGQIQEAHSVSAGLDYPSVGPEHAYLRDIGRVTYTSATDDEALSAFQALSRLEGIIPALESAHAIAHLLGPGHGFGSDDVVVVSLSGRGDKDVYTAAKALGVTL